MIYEWPQSGGWAQALQKHPCLPTHKSIGLSLSPWQHRHAISETPPATLVVFLLCRHKIIAGLTLPHKTTSASIFIRIHTISLSMKLSLKHLWIFVWHKWVLEPNLLISVFRTNSSSKNSRKKKKTAVWSGEQKWRRKNRIVHLGQNNSNDSHQIANRIILLPAPLLFMFTFIWLWLWT